MFFGKVNMRRRESHFQVTTAITAYHNLKKHFLEGIKENDIFFTIRELKIFWRRSWHFAWNCLLCIYCINSLPTVSTILGVSFLCAYSCQQGTRNVLGFPVGFGIKHDWYTMMVNSAENKADKLVFAALCYQRLLLAVSSNALTTSRSALFISACQLFFDKLLSRVDVLRCGFGISHYHASNFAERMLTKWSLIALR